MCTKRVIIGITSASGVLYGITLLRAVKAAGAESHLVMSDAAGLTLGYETGLRPDDLRQMADVAYNNADVGAAIASGSFPVAGMIVAPCSIRTLSEITTGVTSSLLTRAADVQLKERRRLVLMVRETPLHTGHLRTMTAASEMGAIIMPPCPAFYTEPETIQDIVNQTVARSLDLIGIDPPDIRRWGEDLVKGRRKGRASGRKNP